MEPNDIEGPAPPERPTSDTAVPSFLRWELLPPAPTAISHLPPEKPRWWLAIGLFLLTSATATTLSAAWWVWTRTDVVIDLPAMLTPDLVRAVWTDPHLLTLGLQVALPALFILLCHELGHYIACRLYGIRATLPYFLPAPFGFGSLGAFIRIRSPIRNRRELFDVGFAGPAAGFIALLPWLFYGLAHSTPVKLTAAANAAATPTELLVPGRCLMMQLAAVPFHGWLGRDVVLNLHPFALAAWIGLFATALNMLPLGQLDGGHVLYAAIGRRQHRMAWPAWCVLASLSFLWPGWGLWSVLLLWMGVKHPPLWDESEPLDSKRRWLALSALLLFVLCFIPMPLDVLGTP